MRIHDHPVLGPAPERALVTICVDGQPIQARAGEPIAVALAAAGIRALRRTRKLREPRGIYCAVGQCTDCVMVVNGVAGVRTCITPVADGMVISSGAGDRDES